jgi:hypothetical protein
MARDWRKVLVDHGFALDNHFYVRSWPDTFWNLNLKVFADHTWRRDSEYPEDEGSDEYAARIRNRNVAKPDFVRLCLLGHAREWEIATPALAAALDELISAMDKAVQEQSHYSHLTFLAYEALAGIGRKYGRPHNFSEAKEVIKNFYKQLGQGAAFVTVRTGIPAPSRIVKVPVRWFCDMVMIGGGDAPGVQLRGFEDTPPPPRGWSEDQWNYALEIIEYALNEGPDYSGDHVYEPEGDDPEGMLFTPSFCWHYQGGEAAYDKHREAAWDAPGWRT